MNEPHTDFDDDGDELELEPVDAEVDQLRKRRTVEQVRQAEDQFDINTFYTSADGLDVDWEKLKRLRFTTRHLLIATAVIAIGMSIIQNVGWQVGLFVEFLIVLGTGWFLVLKQENIRLEELERKRQQVEARKAAQRAAEDGEPLPELPEPIDKPAEPAFREMEFRFRFAWKESLIALLIAAALLTVMQWVGGPEPAALLIGGLAAVGLCLHWFGIEPPAIWILGWWILLALYIVAFLCGLLAVAEEAKATPIVQVQRWNAEETPVQVKPSAVSYQPSAFPASFSPRAEG